MKNLEELKIEYMEWHKTFRELSYERVRHYREGMSTIEE
jgi:hypothetical protein